MVIKLIMSLMVVGIGWQAYRKARRDETWSNKQFFGVFLGTLGLCAVIAFLIVFISPAKMQAHEGLAIFSILLSIAVGIIVLTLYANRWRKRDLLKRAGQNRTVGLAIVTFLVFAPGVSAQTTYRDPNGAFTVKVPAGWKAERQQDGNGVTISKGDVSATVGVDATDNGSTPTPRQVLDGYEQQVPKECTPPARNLQRGNATVGGLPGAYFLLTCSDQEHDPLTMKFAVSTSNGKMMLFQVSAPSSQYSSAKPALDSIAESFRPEGGSAGNAKTNGWVPLDKSNIDSASSSLASPADSPKVKALLGACSAGAIGPDECAAKLAELTKKGNSTGSSGADPRMQALEKACNAGVFTPQECEAKRAALMGRGLGNRQGSAGDNPPPRSYAQNGGSQQDSPSPAQGNNGGDLYNDPAGNFSIMIPQGWNAKTSGGCYGPEERCPPNSAGVNIKKGTSWAFVAPYSGNARQPTDVVEGVAAEYQRDYQNFQKLQNEPSKFNGLDVAFGTCAGVDDRGVTVSLVIVGIAAPNGRYFVVSSSVPGNELKTTGEEVTRMLNTVRFARQ